MPMEGMEGEREGFTRFGGGVETKTGESAIVLGEADGRWGDVAVVTARTGRVGGERPLLRAKVGETDGRAETGGSWGGLGGVEGAIANAGISVADPAVCSHD